MKRSALWIGALAGGLLASCHSWGFFRPVETPAPFEHADNGGVRWEDVRVGKGKEATPGTHVTVHYVGRLADGTQFDSSRDRGRPFAFTLGRGEVIRGWEQGMLGMHVGGLRKLTIPPELAYGAQGREAIPPNATLTLEVELLDVATQ
jgi:FKBP-type peptidyl-prolyl cis-trans isomerase